MQTSTHQTLTNNAQPESIQAHNMFIKRVGSVTFRVGIYWDASESETLEDKIFRLIKNDLTTAAGCAKMTPLQTVGLDMSQKEV
jgi:hypothetical protein